MNKEKKVCERELLEINDISRREFLETMGQFAAAMILPEIREDNADLSFDAEQSEKEAAYYPIEYKAGLNPGWVIGNEGNLLFTDQVAERYKELGAKVVRAEFRVLGEWNDWTLGLYENFFNVAQAHGLEVLGLVDYSSWAPEASYVDWNRNSAEWERGDGKNDYMTALVDRALDPILRRFGSRMMGVQIWNEQNIPAMKDSKGRPVGSWYLDYSVYAQLLRASYDKIKGIGIESGFDIPLVLGGLLTRDSEWGSSYLNQLHYTGNSKAGWKQGVPYDHVGQHPYVDTRKQTTEYKLYQKVYNLRAAMNNWSGGYKRGIWLTEAGWQSSDLSTDIEAGKKTQAKNLEILYKFMKKYRQSLKLGSGVWFSYGDGWGQTYGLLDEAGNIKPAGTAYQQFANF